MSDDPNTTKRPALSQADVARLLSAFGADRSRWPTQSDAAARPALTVIDRDPARARLDAEAKALDQLLARARPAIDPARLDALTDRIVATAQRTPRMAASSTKRSPSVPPQKAVPVARLSAFTQRRDVRRSLSAIAASLMLGLSIGQAGLLDAAVNGLEDLTGLAFASAQTDVASALSAAETFED